MVGFGCEAVSHVRALCEGVSIRATVRLIGASKKPENYAAVVSLYFMDCNYAFSSVTDVGTES
jgi:hypothetical protein